MREGTVLIGSAVIKAATIPELAAGSDRDIEPFALASGNADCRRASPLTGSLIRLPMTYWRGKTDLTATASGSREVLT